MDIGILSTARDLAVSAVRPVAWLARHARLWVFRRRDRPPLEQAHARGLAHAVLAGKIETAIPYRNFGSDRIFIAAFRCSDDGSYENHVIVLEQFGQSYRKRWESEPFLGFRGLDVEDIDGDGTKEVLFVEESMGSGAGSTILHVLSTARNAIYRLSEFTSWQDAAGPTSPQIEIVPEPDERLRRAIERYAAKRGFLTLTVPDFADPTFAVKAWHADNGQHTEGEVVLRFYAGPPRYGSSPTVTTDAGEVVYTAFFKGPIYGYLRDRDQHFVAFSPAWTYDWAPWIVPDGAQLWFPYKDWFLTFAFEGERGILHRHDRCPPSIREKAAD